MAYYLFDNPKLLILAAVIGETVIFLARALAPDKVKRFYLLAGPVIIVLAVGLDLLVQTDREQIVSSTRAIMQAAEEENARGIIEHLSDNLFYDNRLGKDMAAAEIERRFSRPLIDSNTISRLEVMEMGADSGSVEFKVITIPDPKGPYGIVPMVSSVWRFDFVRDPDGVMRVNDLEMLEFNNGKGFDVFGHWPDSN